MKPRSSKLVVSVSALLWAASACSTLDAGPSWIETVDSFRGLQEPAPETQESEEPPEGEEEEARHLVVAFVGDTIIDGDHAFTLGVDYEYRLHEKVGIGVLVDFVREDLERDEIYAAVAFLHPVGRLTVPLAFGFQHGSGEELLLFRTGVSYEIPVGERYLLAPAVYLDFVEGDEQATVLGIGFGVEF